MDFRTVVALISITATGIPFARAAPPEKYAGNCTDVGCHGDFGKRSVVHSPIETGMCNACHEAKADETHKFKLTSDGAKLCTECHEEEKFQGKFVHHPVSNGQCLACHDPHGSKTKGLLRPDSVGAVCAECHSEILENLAFLHGPAANGQCTACHDAHVSTAKHLLTKPTEDEVCLQCHNKEIQSGGRVVGNVAAHLATNPHHHGPLSNGECAACHNAHGSPWTALGSHPYPSKFYAPFSNDNYKLCFECHDAAAFESAETEDATEFRNGTRNLHFLHVNKADKGRTCRACHDPHASKNDKHIVEKVPFGKWSIPLNFRQTSQGGSCGPGCHRSYSYDRDQPVANVSSR